jgi:hypothetical protein
MISRRHLRRQDGTLSWIGRSLIVATAIILTGGAAWSYWSSASASGGHAASNAVTVNQGAKPTTTVTISSVSISWTATTMSDAAAVDGYVITRYDQSGVAQTMLSNCTGTRTTLTCTENLLPDGTWRYSVTPVYAAHWRGPESPLSDPFVINTAPPGPNLGSAVDFSILGNAVTATVPISTISGNLGTTPSTALTGFDAGQSVVGGDIHANDGAATQARVDRDLAYADILANYPCTAANAFSGDQIGITFAPGVHCDGAAFANTGDMVLDGGGDPNAIFIFKIDAALNTGAGSNIILTNGAKASNVFWQVNGAAGLGANSTFSGTILANGASTLGAGTVLIGRDLATGAITMHGNTVRFTIALAPVVTIDGGATFLTKDPTPTISGTTDAAPGRAVIVTIDGQTLNTTVQPLGTWSVTASAVLANTYDVMVKIRDAAGNAGFATQKLTAEISPDPVDLKTAASYSVLATTTVANTGTTTLDGDLGLSPAGTITGTPTVGGTTHLNDSLAAQARTDFVAAYNDAAGRLPSSSFAGDQIGQTFRPGVHRTTTAFALTGTLTLDADGVASSVFIIQVGAAMGPAASSHVVLANGAKASNVYWQVNGAVSTGASSTLVGTILADGAVTLGAGSSLVGRLMSTGTVTLSGNTISMN